MFYEMLFLGISPSLASILSRTPSFGFFLLNIWFLLSPSFIFPPPPFILGDLSKHCSAVTIAGDSFSPSTSQTETPKVLRVLARPSLLVPLPPRSFISALLLAADCEAADQAKRRRRPPPHHHGLHSSLLYISQISFLCFMSLMLHLMISSLPSRFSLTLCFLWNLFSIDETLRRQKVYRWSHVESKTDLVSLFLVAQIMNKIFGNRLLRVI